MKIYFFQLEAWKKALTSADQLLSTQSGDQSSSTSRSKCLFRKATALRALKRNREALDALEEAAALDPGSQVRFFGCWDVGT